MRRLAVIHVDGVGYDILRQAAEGGTMPHVAHLLETGYAVRPYRCGVPSTTPYAQAGILYGDNTNIPGFRWYDKRSGARVRFGVDSSFNQVAQRYFQGCVPLTTGGAAIAACYPAGARRTFGIAFRERHHGTGPNRATGVIGRFLLNPAHWGDLAWEFAYTTTAGTRQYFRERVHREHPALPYVVADVAEEVFVHDLTRYAVEQAMLEGEPVIYAGLYAYDEAAHGFGPEDPLSFRMLRHLDRTLQGIFDQQRKVAADGLEYEVVVLSDHGQTASHPFTATDKRPLAQVLSDWEPTFQVEDLKGKTYGPQGDALDGHLVVAASGGLAHVYLSNVSGRLDFAEVDAVVPGLAERLARHPGISFALMRDGGRDVVVTDSGVVPLDRCGDRLAAFDDPEILQRQLSKLNSFETAGDIILIGRWAQGRQINFENQLGGHGSIGGEQGHPFVLARAELGLPVEGITDSAELHPILRGLAPQATV